MPIINEDQLVPDVSYDDEDEQPEQLRSLRTRVDSLLRPQQMQLHEDQGAPNLPNIFHNKIDLIRSSLGPIMDALEELEMEERVAIATEKRIDLIKECVDEILKHRFPQFHGDIPDIEEQEPAEADVVPDRQNLREQQTIKIQSCLFAMYDALIDLGHEDGVSDSYQRRIVEIQECIQELLAHIQAARADSQQAAPRNGR